MRSLLFAALALAVASCDPVREQAIDELGPEAPGVDQGPTHRPGQPCLVCHGAGGPEGPTFSVAGTIFRTRDARVGVPGAVVTITDADGVTRRFGTNEVGTFFVQESEWKPKFPLRTSVASGTTTVEMKTLINGDGSCGSCHRDPAARDAAGHIYIEDSP